MAYIQLREKARALRRQGESIGKISQTLRASKSTVSYWCRDIELSAKQIDALARKQEEGGAFGRLRAAEAKRALRISATREEFEHGKRTVGSLNRRDIFMVGAALYWGEGYKSGNEECGLTNSNPDIIRAFIAWLGQIHNVNPSDLILRVSINQTHMQRIRPVEKYWSKATKISLSQFTRASFIKTRTRKMYANHDEHFGTLRVKVRRATTLRRRILGSIAEIARQIHSIYLNSLNTRS